MNDRNHTGIIFSADDYAAVDGARASETATPRITVGAPRTAANADQPLCVQFWQGAGEDMAVAAVVPLHQLLDACCLLGEGLMHLREAYRYPQGYDVENPQLARVGVQGAAFTASVCTENGQIVDDLRAAETATAELGERLGERIRRAQAVLNEVATYY